MKKDLQLRIDFGCKNFECIIIKQVEKENSVILIGDT